MAGPTLIARAVPKASKAIMGKDKSKARISMARVADQWEEIIAPEDPMLIRPVRISWKWQGEGDAKTSEGTIHIAAPSALATKLKFQEAIIVGRLNRIFGLNPRYAMKRIALSHDRIAPPLKRRTRQKGVIEPDTALALKNIEDPVLRERLAGLAEAMASKT